MIINDIFKILKEYKLYKIYKNCERSLNNYINYFLLIKYSILSNYKFIYSFLINNQVEFSLFFFILNFIIIFI